MKSIINTATAVVCAMFGVRSSKGFEADKKLSVGAILITAFLFTLLFISSLILLIKFVVLA